MTRVLVLGAGPLQLPAIRAAKRLGAIAVVADGDANAVGLQEADISCVVDIRDPEQCLAVARRERVDAAVHICSEVAMSGLGLVNESLGLHGIDRATAARATNKAAMRRAFEAARLPSPRFLEAHTEAEAWAALRELGAPAIVKPSRSSGSRGITQVQDPDDAAVVSAAISDAFHHSRDPSILVEEFVDGPEFSLEVLTYRGESTVLAVTDKLTSGPPNWVELGHSQPSQYPTDAMIALAKAAVSALGIDWSASHVEMRLTPTGPVLIEVGARMGGDFITTELVPRSTGIDMTAAVVALALGRRPKLTPRPTRGVAIRYLSPSPGHIRAIRGVEAAKAIDGVEVVDVYVGPGSYFAGVTSSLSRAGHVIAEGRDAPQAIERAEAAVAAIVFEPAPSS